MNENAKKNFSIEAQANFYLNSFPRQLNPIDTFTKYTFGSQILKKISQDHSFYREFKTSDPNALVKIIILSIFEFLFSICENSDDFLNGLTQFINFERMFQCQNELSVKYSITDLVKIRNEFKNQLYKVKKMTFKPWFNSQVIYDLLSMDEKYSVFLSLVGRGLVLDFLSTDSDAKTVLKNHAKNDLQSLSSVLKNYKEDLTSRNRLILDILCITSGRNLLLIYPNHDSEAKYPNVLTSNSTFVEKVICTDDSLFWLINNSLYDVKNSQMTPKLDQSEVQKSLKNSSELSKSAPKQENTQNSIQNLKEIGMMAQSLQPGSQKINLHETKVNGNSNYYSKSTFGIGQTNSINGQNKTVLDESLKSSTSMNKGFIMGMTMSQSIQQKDLEESPMKISTPSMKQSGGMEVSVNGSIIKKDTENEEDGHFSSNSFRRTEGHFPIKKLKQSALPKHLGDEDDIEDSTEEYCKVCGSIANKCKKINSIYCEACKVFYCGDCRSKFDERTTCRCQRCLCCFQEYCKFPNIIGLLCQTMCNMCFEENDPKTFNLVRYPCGHGFCRYCLFKQATKLRKDPRFCLICRR